jgi:hypothetical protein
MGLAKLTITPFSRPNSSKNLKKLPETENIKVLFNPESYSVSKTVAWGQDGDQDGKKKNQIKINAPIIKFGGGGSRQLTLELFFDATLATPPLEDVRQETNRITALTIMQEGEDHPRVCLISWGDAPVNSDFPFKGVITSLTQKFTLFNSNGKPLRANLNLTLLEYLEPEEDQRKTDPELATRLVKRGDTLSGIAAQMYHDPSKWRVIAEANRIADPRDLNNLIGQTVTIPKLR